VLGSLEPHEIPLPDSDPISVLSIPASQIVTAKAG
jgi:hypothetical protein